MRHMSNGQQAHKDGHCSAEFSRWMRSELTRAPRYKIAADIIMINRDITHEKESDLREKEDNQPQRTNLPVWLTRQE